MMRVLWGLLGVLFSVSAWGQPYLYVEGKDYQRAPTKIVEDPVVQSFRQEGKDKIQVIEFFSYACSWCYKLDPYVNAWAKTLPNYVDFRRIPVEFQPSWQTLARAYFTIRDLHAFDTVHAALFAAIHTSQLTDSAEPVLREFFIQQGIKGEDFDKVFHSAEVDAQQKQANALSQAYRVTAVPAIIVQGPAGAYVSTIRMAGSEENLLKVVNFLIQQEHLNAS